MKTNLLKLSAQNSWEYVTFFANKQKVQDLKEVLVSVKGKNKKFKVKKSTRYASYSDMGHRSDVSSPDFCIQIKNELGMTDNVSLYDLLERKVKIFVEEKNVTNQEGL